MELIPFNLEKAIAGEPIQYRNGRPTKFIAYVPELAEDQRVLCLYGEAVLHHAENGKYLFSGGAHNFDLFMAPKTVDAFLNVFNTFCSYGYESMRGAEERQELSPISICRLSILNGEVVGFETVKKY